MKVSMIAAVAANGVIGKDNDLVWHLPDDMKYFQEKTRGHHVIMGRKNYDSLPPKFQPLPGRTNIILTRQKDFKAEGSHVVHDMDTALEICRKSKEDEAFIIGGADIYKLGFEYADFLYLTEIGNVYDGDTRFPEYDKMQWEEVARVHHPADEIHEAPMDFVTYRKK